MVFQRSSSIPVGRSYFEHPDWQREFFSLGLLWVDPVKNEVVQILFSGFQDAAGVRQFAFDRIADDRSRTRLVVTADMTLARKYDIRLQELPLLCRRLLDESGAEHPGQPISLTEQHMAAIRATVRAGAEKKPRQPTSVSSNTGRAWR